jgi:hypothetical protein
MAIPVAPVSPIGIEMGAMDLCSKIVKFWPGKSPAAPQRYARTRSTGIDALVLILPCPVKLSVINY